MRATRIARAAVTAIATAAVATATLSSTAGTASAASPPPRTFELVVHNFEVLWGNENRDEVLLEFHDGARWTTLWYGENLDAGDKREFPPGGARIFFNTRGGAWVHATEQDNPPWDPHDHIGWFAVPKHEHTYDSNGEVMPTGIITDGATTYRVEYEVFRA